MCVERTGRFRGKSGKMTEWGAVLWCMADSPSLMAFCTMHDADALQSGSDGLMRGVMGDLTKESYRWRLRFLGTDNGRIDQSLRLAERLMRYSSPCSVHMPG